jgi:hypothetical protein
MTKDSAPLDRRQLLAAVLLMELPTPQSVEFLRDDSLRLAFDSVAACTAWADTLGVSVTRWQRHQENNVHAIGVLAGREVCLLGSEPASAPEPPVTGTTRDRLVELAGEVA